MHPVEAHRRAHHVEPGLRVVEDGVGAGDAAERDLDAAPLDLPAHRLEALEHLVVAVRVLHEAREQARDPDVRHCGDPLDEIGREVVAHADAAKAGVHLHEDLRDPSPAASRRIERERRLLGEHRHRQSLLDDAIALRVGEQDVHHQHLALDAGGAQSLGLQQLGDHHPADALLHQVRGDGNESVPVGVVLHHRHHLHLRPDPFPDAGEVEAQAVEVELDPGRMFVEPAGDFGGVRLGLEPGMGLRHRR